MNLEQLTINVSNGLFLTFVLGIPLFGFMRKVKVYTAFVEGAKDGFSLVIKIMPYLVGMLVAIGMLRASGAFELMASVLAPVLRVIGMPADILPLALIRPFSGGAANGVFADIALVHGGDSYIARLAATMIGSTETTFYVLAVYFGAVHIHRTRHAVPAGLVADIAGIIAALVIFQLIYGRYIG